MFDITKYRGVVSTAVAVAVAVAGALNQPQLADALKALGLDANTAIDAAAGLVSGVLVVIGALSHKVQSKEASAVSAVTAAVKADPANAPAVVKAAVADAQTAAS